MRILACGCQAGGILTSPLTRRTSSHTVERGTPHDRYPANHPTEHHRGAQSRRRHLEVPNDSPETVAAKARELRLFQPEWEALGPRGRKPWLLKFQEWILDNAEHITDVLQSETGKVRAEASMEVPMTADILNYWAQNAEAFLADSHPKPHSPLGKTKRLTTVHRPYPVVGLIIP